MTAHRVDWFCLLFILGACPALVLGQAIQANGLNVDVTDTTFADLQPFLSEVQVARVVHLRTVESDDVGVPHEARQWVIQWLHEQAGYTVLVMPVGIFEGAWVQEQLTLGMPPEEAAAPLYRVWREDPAFWALLRFLQQRQGLELIGGLSRFHATGKALYALHLTDVLGAAELERPEDLLERIEEDLGGRSRLSRGTVEARQRARATTAEILAYVEAHREALLAVHGPRRFEREAHFLRNMEVFIELEQLRAGDLPEDPNFTTREKAYNLTWMLASYYPDQKLIYWEGRGADEVPLPTNEPIFTLTLSAR